ncbi:unnamed protein product [Adineta steineri]|uniref:Uncharacterized protein n=1 Tax=Adineta steineri TaxID=433720 RepID=A0A813VNS6_9BILA|nr:unnamed protein product [Adineta steineri]CAF3565864.1 unnamed protein product [Adineta steineri]
MAKVISPRIERLILECDRLDQEARGTVDRTLADVNKKLGELDKEIDAIQVYLVHLEKSLQDNLHITLLREKRYDIDLVHDDVEKDLVMEISAIQRAISLLRRTIE